MKDREIEPILNALKICIEKIDILKTYYSWLEANELLAADLLEKNDSNMNSKVSVEFFRNLKIKISDLERTLEVANKVLNELESEGEIISIQYKTFLNSELTNFNWSQFSYIEKRYVEMIGDFERTLKNKTPLTGNDFAFLNILNFIIASSDKFKSILIGKISSINIFTQIHHINNNIVIIGSNGSGKSTFARNLNGKLEGNFSIISAQHLLIYESPKKINPNQSSVEDVRNFQRFNKLGSDKDLANLFQNDFSNLVLALFEEKAERERKYYSGLEERKVSILDSTIEVWQELITHRRILQNKGYDILVETLNGSKYNFNNLSDGEKAIFYYIGHVLLAEENSYIIVDEPENHLHLSICIKLWNILEQLRPNCKFIYITHNLDFAVSRNDTTVLWNKNFDPPFDWEVEKIKPDETIPDILMFEIMGSRRNVVFCEGDNRNSLDYKIYSRLFPNYNVIPVNGHDNVISYCKSFNQNKGLSMLEAFGIVDGDVWTEKEIQSMHKKNILVLPYNEIENLICSKGILEFVINLVGSDGQCLDEFINEFFKSVESKKGKISTWYANNRINNHFKHNMFKQDKDISKLKEEVEKIVAGDMIQKFYEEMLNRIEKDLESQTFENLIRYVNLKKQLSKELANKYIVNNYEERFINLLNSNAEFKEFIEVEIVDKYFSLLSKT